MVDLSATMIGDRSTGKADPTISLAWMQRTASPEDEPFPSTLEVLAKSVHQLGLVIGSVRGDFGRICLEDDLWSDREEDGV